MTPSPSPALPIDAALPELRARLAQGTAAVLVAPPGAGKTTRVPLALLDEPWLGGRKILVLEPRRLAARAAAERMAATLGDKVGDTVGYRVRFGSKVTRRTRIEVVTEGIFTALIVDDPSLEGVGAVLFDEFHERSLDADLGLALARDAQQGLREDLRLLVMSATIDGARIAKALGDAPVIESTGTAFEVATRYLGRNPARPIEAELADAAIRALRVETASILAFLPGMAEIRRCERLIRERGIDPQVDVVALFGALDAEAQHRAIAPAPRGRRKVVLATSIAETSITIEGVRVVIDSGLARVPRYEPDIGLTRLETVRVSRASADQRRGRAGRVGPGVCYRLWDEAQTGALAPFAQPEILAADLSSLVLDLAQWGAGDPAGLVFLDPPPAAALSEARALLLELGAIDASGRITAAGKALNRLPLPARLARMVTEAGREGTGRRAAEIAVVVTERGLGGDDIDLGHRLDGLRRDRSQRAEDARRMASRWAGLASADAETAPLPWLPAAEVHGARADTDRAEMPLAQRRNPSPQKSNSAAAATRSPSHHRGAASPGAILALAYPDRIAKNRGAGPGAFLLANGRGAKVDPASPLAREPYLAVAELVGTAAQSRITLAAPISLTDIETRFADRIETREEIACDLDTLALRGRRSRRLGALSWGEQPFAVVATAATAAQLADAIVQAGLDRLPWTSALRQWRDRVLFLRRAEGEEWPDLSNAGLARTAAAWLPPLFADKTALAMLGAPELDAALRDLLPYPLRRRLDAEAPTHFVAPSGSRLPIEYAAEDGPKLAIRVQELFGLDRHPAIAGGRVPLLVELLSPAHRPVQVTRDLPQFWRGSYAAVKSEMRGRYPRHPWPDDPLAAAATRRAKPRGR